MKKFISALLALFLFPLIVACVPTTTTSTVESTTSSTISTTTSASQIIAETVAGLSNPYNVGLFITETPESSIGVNFKLSTETEAYVEYHQWDLDNFLRAEATMKSTAVGSNTVYLYEATMTGLVPGQTYEYFISDSSGVERSETYEFTMPEDLNTSFTFMYLTDTQGASSLNYMAYAYSILNVLEYNQLEYDFVMFPGDTVNDHDSRSQWNWFFQYSSFFITSKPSVITLGNHESGYVNDERINNLEFDGYYNLPNNGPVYEPFDEIEGDLRGAHFDDGKTYSFDYGNAHFIVINTESICDGHTACSEYDVSNVEILKTWIRNDLENNDLTWTIALMHRGPYGLSYDTYNVRDVLTPLFDEFNVDLVLSGHEHQYSRAIYSQQVMVPFQEANQYARGILNLVESELYTNHFNHYSSSLGVTYLTGNTASVKFYGGERNSGIEVQYKYIQENPVIPFITVTVDSIHVTSYGVSKTNGLDIVPTGVYILEDFIITK